jgi:hypothetical protein
MATGYAAYSVSESQLDRVYQYINKQKAHHQKRSFDDEYQFVRLYHVNG